MPQQLIERRCQSLCEMRADWCPPRLHANSSSIRARPRDNVGRARDDVGRAGSTIRSS